MRLLVTIAACSILAGSANVFADPAPAAATDKFGLEASKVTVRVKDVPLDEVLRAFADQSGNSRMDLPDNWEAKGVSFDVADAPYWQALDKLCGGLGLRCALRIGKGKIDAALVSGKFPASAAAYSGPLVVRLAGVAEHERSVEAGTKTLGLSLAWFCEDRLHPLDSKASVARIAAPDGRDLAFTAAEGEPPVEGWPPRAVMRPAVVNGKVIQVPDVSPTFKPPPVTSAGTVVAKLEGLPAAMRSLQSVEGTVRMTLGLGRKELKIQDVLGGRNNTAEVGGDKIVVTHLGRGVNTISVKIRCTSGGGNVDLRTLDAQAPYGVRLVAADGTSIETTMLKKLPLAMPAGEGAAPVAPANEDEGAFLALFLNPPNIDGAWTLIVTVPESRVAKDFAFRLNDVPLP